jgi:predicted GNAT family acetyltransferase
MPNVLDNREAKQFEITIDGHTAVLRYERTPTALVLIHTEVPPELRGRHLADQLAKAGIDAAHAEKLTLMVICPFVRAYLRKHPDPTAQFVDNA